MMKNIFQIAGFCKSFREILTMKSRNSKKIIRSSKHSLKFANTNKLESISHFLDSFRFATQKFIDFVWNNSISWSDKTFNIQTLQLDCPNFLDHQIVKFPTDLSARALSSATNQALGIIRSKTNEVRNIRFGAQQELLKSQPNQKKLLALQSKLSKALKRMRKPVLSDDFKAELSSKNLTLEIPEQAKHFDRWLHLGALGFCKSLDFPVKFHKHCQALKKQGFTQMTSFLLGKDSVEIRWSKQIETRKTGISVGCDTGMNSVATFSEISNDHNQFAVNGVNYSQVIDRLSRKRKGSKNFQQTLHHRDCILRAILNRANLDSVKTIFLENNSTLKSKFKGLKLARHSWQTIQQKIHSLSELLGVQVIQTSSPFKSQRCSSCGWTQKSNRSGESFICKSCGFALNADLNSARNQVLQLPELDFIKIRDQRKNLQGFFWLASGESGVPHEMQHSKPLTECFSVF